MVGIADAGRKAYPAQVIFEHLRLWMDPLLRPGPEAMAVDEWLLETTDFPVLRVYGWLGEWGSVGYFGSLAEARASFPGVQWVRRWTGGGTVDHRADWTYSVIAPKQEALVKLRGAESYRVLHAALAEGLRAEGMEVRLSTGAEETGAALCFENPVGHDLVDGQGRKLAGAGQRRTSLGLLHQGSLAAACDPAWSLMRAERLASCLAEDWKACGFDPPMEAIAEKIRGRYAMPSWTERR